MMISPFDIKAGDTYMVQFGMKAKQVYITEREGMSLQSYVWIGVILETGTIVRISDYCRFTKKINPALAVVPWLLAIDFDRQGFFEYEWHELEYFQLSIRNLHTLDLIADFPDVLTKAQSVCARVFRDAFSICKKAGPNGSDLEHLYLCDPEASEPFAKIDLSIGKWNPEFATAYYIKALMAKVHEEARRIEDSLLEQSCT